VPHKGEKMEVGNVMVSVEKVERTRVVEVLVTLREAGQAGAAT
jgi:CBS domain containing-hemolysin-like protein